MTAKNTYKNNGRQAIKRIIATIKSAKTFLVSAHVNVEGDALGSVLAMSLALRKLGKKVTACNHDITPGVYSFLPGVKFIKNEPDSLKYDVAFVLDCSDSSRTGKVKDFLPRAATIINIDHHISNTHFGDINWVDFEAGSACLLIYQLLRKLKVMDKDIALNLYTGMFTDTGNFTYSSTNARTHQAVAWLMRYKIDPPVVYDKLHSSYDFSDMHYMAKILSALRHDSSRRICWISIDDWKAKEFDITEVVFTVMRLLKGVEVFILFKKLPEHKVRINFRSKYFVDVNRIAQFFGGGGHKRASGTTVEGNLPEVEKKVINFIKRSTGKARKV